MIIDVSYFQQDIILPETDVNKTYGKNLKDRIAALEPKFLIDILGYKMYNDLNSNQSATSGEWFELIDGKDFTDKYGNLNHWNGLGNKTDNPIANFIYTKMIREKHSTVTTLGITKAAHENAQPSDPIEKVLPAWNTMVEVLWILDDFLRQNESLYPDYFGLNYAPFKVRGNYGFQHPNNKYFQLMNFYTL